jgi:uncharacterized protein (DUF2141 family)
VRGIDAEHADLAGGARAEALEDLDRRRLARAVRPEEGEDLAALHLEVDPGDRVQVAVALLQPANGDDRLHASSVGMPKGRAVRYT